MTADGRRGLAIIGGGKIGEALLSGLIRRGGPDGILVCERSPERAAELAERYGVPAVDLAGAVARARVLLLAVKPQDIDVLLGRMAEMVDDGHLVVSVAAGVPTARIEAVRITNLSWTEDALPSGDVTIAIQEPAAAYQLRWHLVPVGNSYVFSPLESDGTVMARAGDFDGSSGEAPQAPTSEAPAEGEQPAEGTPAPGRTETAGG